MWASTETGAISLPQDINSLNKQIAQLQDFVRAKGSQSGRHVQTHSNTIVVSLQVRGSGAARDRHGEWAVLAADEGNGVALS